MEKKDQHTYCPKCNSIFICKSDDITNCFCYKISIPKKVQEFMKNNYKSCLCNNCINELIKNSNRLSFIFIFLLLNVFCFGQFHSAAGTLNTSAMHKDSIAFVAWAKTCNVTRGWQDVTNTSLGTVTVGLDDYGTLKAGENPIVSLGDGGIAVLTFSNTIINGPGYDFAIFENGFADDFLELAFVEVSSDGINYYRFPATSNTQFTTQIAAFDPLDCTKLNNLAGKYRANYGTPFDLEELKNISGLDVNAITHVKIIDVVGSITPSLATFDMNNNPINDPFPTAFGSGGFDLDAVGVINENPSGIEENSSHEIYNIFPNPCSDKLFISLPETNTTVTFKLFNATGVVIESGKLRSSIDLKKLINGIYFLELIRGEKKIVQKIVVYK